MIDAHCHLQDLNNIGTEVQRCKAIGITTLICNGSDLESSQKAIKIAEKFPQVFATVGCHPDVKVFDKKLFLKLSQHKKVVAIGECGLDSPNSTQIELLKWHIQLAKETGLPLVIHCRNAFDDIFEMIDYDQVQMHCFTGNMDQMRECVRRGWYVSLGGIVTFKASHDLREVAKQVPTERLLIETDSPYISPEPLRGKTNYPANLIYIARLIAQLRSISIDALDRLTTANTYNLFPKLKLPSL